MLTLSLETENNDYNTDEVYNQNLLDDLLKQDDIDRFREEFLAMHEYEQSEYFEDTTNENRQRYLNFITSRSREFFEQLEIDDEAYEDLLIR